MKMYEHKQREVKICHVNWGVFFFITTKDDTHDKRLKSLKTDNKRGCMLSNTWFSLQAMTILSFYQVFSKNMSIPCLIDKFFPLW